MKKKKKEKKLRFNISRLLVYLASFSKAMSGSVIGAPPLAAQKVYAALHTVVRPRQRPA